MPVLMLQIHKAELPFIEHNTCENISTFQLCGQMYVEELKKLYKSNKIKKHSLTAFTINKNVYSLKQHQNTQYCFQYNVYSNPIFY